MLHDLISQTTGHNRHLQAILRDIVQSMGVPVLTGNVYVAMPATDPAYDMYRKLFNRKYEDGTEMVYTTIAAAYAAMTSNRHDLLLISGNATHTLTSMLTVAKNRVHFFGMDPIAGRRYGQAAKISLGVTTAATDLGAILNTGVRNSFQNLKVLSSNTKDESLYTFLDGGEYTFMENVELYKSTDLDVTGAAELVANGDSSHYKDCYIGSTVDAISGSIIRPCVTFSRGLAASGKVARDVTFENCIFARKCGDTANRFVYGAEANAVERLALFENCKFWNAKLATAVPAQNVAFGSSLTDGQVLLNNCVAQNAATAMSTTTGVFVNGPVPAADTSGISLQAS